MVAETKDGVKKVASMDANNALANDSATVFMENEARMAVYRSAQARMSTAFEMPNAAPETRHSGPGSGHAGAAKQKISVVAAMTTAAAAATFPHSEFHTAGQGGSCEGEYARAGERDEPGFRHLPERRPKEAVELGTNQRQ